jgi:hypothetical protein
MLSLVSSVELEVRVLAEPARFYTKEIHNRLNERACVLEKGDVDLVLDKRIG